MANQCWAYNTQGQRCEKPAAHTGNHGITSEWTDDECYSPIKHQLPTPTPAPPVLAAPINNVCVACQHRHKGGDCKCGCYEFIG